MYFGIGDRAWGHFFLKKTEICLLELWDLDLCVLYQSDPMALIKFSTVIRRI